MLAVRPRRGSQSSMEWLSLVMVLIAGSLLPLQAGVNALLANSSGHTIWAAGMSFFVGTFALLALFIMPRTPWPMISQLRAAPAMALDRWINGGIFRQLYGFFCAKTRRCYAIGIGHHRTDRHVPDSGSLWCGRLYTAPSQLAEVTGFSADIIRGIFY